MALLARVADAAKNLAKLEPDAIQRQKQAQNDGDLPIFFLPKTSPMTMTAEDGDLNDDTVGESDARKSNDGSLNKQPQTAEPGSEQKAERPKVDNTELKEATESPKKSEKLADETKPQNESRSAAGEGNEETLRKKLEESELYLTRVIQKLADSESRGLDLQQQNENDRKSKVKLQNKVRTLENELRLLKEQIEKEKESSDTRDKSHLKVEISQLQNKLNKAQENASSLQAKLEQAERDHEEKTQALAKEKEELQKEANFHKQREIEYEMKHQKGLDDLKTINLEKKNLEESLAKLRAEKMVVDDLERQLSHAREQLAHTQHELWSKSEEIISVQDLIKQNTLELTELKEQNAELHRELQQKSSQHIKEISKMKEHHSAKIASIEREHKAALATATQSGRSDLEAKISRLEKEVQHWRSQAKDKEKILEHEMEQQRLLQDHRNKQRKDEDFLMMMERNRREQQMMLGSTASTSGVGAIVPLSDLAEQDEITRLLERDAYVKQVVFKFFTVADSSIRYKLFHVLAVILRFSPTELQSIYKINREFDPHRTDPLAAIADIINLLLGSP